MPANAPLVLFGPDHLGAVAVTGLVTTILCVWLRYARGTPAVRIGTCLALGGLLILAASLGQLYQALYGKWTVAKSLPLHLCNLATLVAALALFGAASALARRCGPRATVNGPSGELARPGLTQVLYELTYYWGMGGTTQALLTPEIEDAFPTAPYFLFFTSHGGVIAAALAMTIGLRMRPRPDSFQRVWIVTVCVATVVFCFNLIAGTNYMYLAGPPDRPSLYDYFGRWPWSLVTLAAVGTIVFGLCYLPFWIMDRSRRVLMTPQVENAR